MTAYTIPPDVIHRLGGVVAAHALVSDILGVSYFASNPGEMARTLLLTLVTATLPKAAPS